MPAPERTTLPAIVAAARDLLEEGGTARVSMQAVAERVGVRAPSLYKRVRDRDALMRLVVEATVADLGSHLAASDGTLAGLARAYRAFGHARPEAFRLMYASSPDQLSLERASEPVLRAAHAAVGDERALDAARLLTAWATGFVSMELAGAFRLGGDIDAAFDYGLDRLDAALRA
ncbi:TetR/AcrR family transcriptional regulator [Microbacterium sp. zg.Y1090]|uniref:TetR/AcrR family transcriptional regulator n=1 Tax=Microbacterium TaxID=33882 RepID=UPI00214B0018|nr:MULTISPECIES: TetR/AcrR family transcriptional regulator [unclassified Microbacterium]MCR2812842.1 TetR/AcrR family transcriptional regulator [Microbacterium sp. zg.Y1084]MCR2817355.1 TetR/AcrR family transcriptional regulator [Microbacterium sp. zg.Y1090]MDL5485986.1 TetR/AcrR family transcriptional regulator [Microbacterium sp. zg-Y1211]WIM29158.1 TetR/AcrR family transcriptional regulator [Microbacterium sp. zg-Y1090]